MQQHDTIYTPLFNLNNRDIYNSLGDSIKMIKQILHAHIYSNNYNVITNIVDPIDNIINPFSVVYDSNNRTINVKIKKTSMKKYDNYKDSMDFYYSLFGEFIYNFIYSMFDQIYDQYNLYIDMALGRDELLSLIHNNIYLYFGITTLTDNFVIIHL